MARMIGHTAIAGLFGNGSQSTSEAPSFLLEGPLQLSGDLQRLYPP